MKKTRVGLQRLSLSKDIVLALAGKEASRIVGGEWRTIVGQTQLVPPGNPAGCMSCAATVQIQCPTIFTCP
ncbi:hypothetical protein [Taibaiella koreensis]|uniref:hypothetical protein n=1 Tax=Taibaiella koreensis TaxID=1268548 RepID=UPI000E59979D|nr:hypothetical protein [Taibaiella koreensis]